jgi:hypothetical protein
MLNRAHLVVRVDGKRPIAVVVMAGSAMIAEVTIAELKRVHDQIGRMEDHIHGEQEHE